VTDRFYPKPSRYFARLHPERPIFQGDVFRGGFGALWRRHTLVQGHGYAILLPQLYEYAEQEKGSIHPFRLVAPLFPLNARAGVDHDLVRAGRVGHTLWIPRWTDHGPQDYFADLRLTTSLDATFLTRHTRVAALSNVAWLAMVDRLSRYFVGIPLDVNAFAVQQAHLHPDAVS
jgi:hypothetical protein